MSTDSFHHVIEQGMRKKQCIKDFVDLVEFSGKAFVMEHDHFLPFERGSNEMHWKESNMDEFQRA